MRAFSDKRQRVAHPALAMLDAVVHVAPSRVTAMTSDRLGRAEFASLSMGIVHAELDSLGLNFRARSRGGGGRGVPRDVFEEGRTAGFGFEYTPCPGHGG